MVIFSEDDEGGGHRVEHRAHEEVEEHEEHREREERRDHEDDREQKYLTLLRQINRYPDMTR